MKTKSLEEIKNLLKEHKKILRKQFGVKELAIFGSYVKEEQTLASDIDVLVEFETRCKTSDCVKTNFEFLFSHYSTLFDYKLDLLNHFLSVFCLFLPLFATLNQIF